MRRIKKGLAIIAAVSLLMSYPVTFANADTTGQENGIEITDPTNGNDATEDNTAQNGDIGQTEGTEQIPGENHQEDGDRIPSEPGMNADKIALKEPEATTEPPLTTTPLPPAQSTSPSDKTETVIVKNDKIITPRKSLPNNTNLSSVTVKINCKGNKVRTYKIYDQKSFKKGSYIYKHGCAACSLTTLMRAYVGKYAKYTPNDTYMKLEKKIFGSKAWNKNYKHKKNPVSLYGISTILSKHGIKNKYVRTFKNKAAVKEIKAHLYSGRPVVIESNSHKQKDGKFAKKYTSRWAGTKHTMVLLGMTDGGKAIVADSAFRTWGGKNQRIKYGTVEDLVNHMIPCSKKSNSFYYTHMESSGGYILINE